MWKETDPNFLPGKQVLMNDVPESSREYNTGSSKTVPGCIIPVGAILTVIKHSVSGPEHIVVKYAGGPRMVDKKDVNPYEWNKSHYHAFQSLSEQLMSDSKAMDLIWDNTLFSDPFRFKAGDKARIKECDASYRTWSSFPYEGTTLDVGDVILIEWQSGILGEPCYAFRSDKLSDRIFFVRDSILEPVTENGRHKCHCPSSVVFHQGCQCGGE